MPTHVSKHTQHIRLLAQELLDLMAYCDAQAGNCTGAPDNITAQAAADVEAAFGRLDDDLTAMCDADTPNFEATFDRLQMSFDEMKVELGEELAADRYMELLGLVRLETPEDLREACYRTPDNGRLTAPLLAFVQENIAGV